MFDINGKVVRFVRFGGAIIVAWTGEKSSFFSMVKLKTSDSVHTI